MAESNPHQTEDEDFSKQRQEEMKLIHSLKQGIQTKVVAFLHELDKYHLPFQSSYNQCIETKCEPLRAMAVSDGFKVKNKSETT